jgi:hypothetical protein
MRLDAVLSSRNVFAISASIFAAAPIVMRIESSLRSRTEWIERHAFEEHVRRDVHGAHVQPNSTAAKSMSFRPDRWISVADTRRLHWELAA